MEWPHEISRTIQLTVFVEPTEGLEPPTVGLQIRRTTSCATLALAMPNSNHSSMKRMIYYNQR